MPVLPPTNPVNTNDELSWRDNPPEPFRWHIRPGERTELNDEWNYSTAMGYIFVGPRDEFLAEGVSAMDYKNLEEWATARGLILKNHSYSETYVLVGENHQYHNRPRWLNVQKQEWVNEAIRAGVIGRYDNYFTNRFRECPQCGVLEFSDLSHCPNGHAIYCPGCNHSMGPDDNCVWDEYQGTYYCTHCGESCAICENVTFPDREYCNIHSVADRCQHCGSVYEWMTEDEPMVNEYVSDNPVGQIYHLCDECSNVFCNSCGNLRARHDHEGQRYCNRCFTEMMVTTDIEEFDETSNINAPDLQMETIPGREMIRLCGIEIEGGNPRRGMGTAGGNAVARDIYAAGLSTYDRMTDYHRAGNAGFAHVETDSSVDWELVIGPVNMANLDSVRNMNKSVKIVRELIKSEVVKLDLRCGTHIHIGAERVSVSSAFNLHHIYAYAEDVLYRLGAAKWPIHRAISNNSEYCRPILKHDSATRFATMNQSPDNHHNGLYFGNYFQSMMNGCSCGVIRFGLDWKECTCQNLGKCTFEFRIFNSTANQKKLHAYLALCQSLVAKSCSMETISGEQADQLFPAQEWNERRYKDLNDQEAEEIKQLWLPRLDFLVNHIPLTEKEKKSVKYCVENSELKHLGPGPIEAIFNNEFTTEKERG